MILRWVHLFRCCFLFSSEIHFWTLKKLYIILYLTFSQSFRDKKSIFSTYKSFLAYFLKLFLIFKVFFLSFILLYQNFRANVLTLIANLCINLYKGYLRLWAGSNTKMRIKYVNFNFNCIFKEPYHIYLQNKSYMV